MNNNLLINNYFKQQNLNIQLNEEFGCFSDLKTLNEKIDRMIIEHKNIVLAGLLYLKEMYYFNVSEDLFNFVLLSLYSVESNLKKDKILTDEQLFAVQDRLLSGQLSEIFEGKIHSDCIFNQYNKFEIKTLKNSKEYKAFTENPNTDFLLILNHLSAKIIFSCIDSIEEPINEENLYKRA